MSIRHAGRFFRSSLIERLKMLKGSSLWDSYGTQAGTRIQKTTKATNELPIRDIAFGFKEIEHAPAILDS